ncbi:MAG: hypothetical protein WA958_15340 [Tunicatimonas sp.]
MYITFKNVGQGDSIILEWQKESGGKGVGIVDCKLHNGKNPTVLHVQQAAYTSIDFIILSHPHHDHFSGMLELIAYCEDKQIVIGCFYHTCRQHPDYIKAACKSIAVQKGLIQLLQKIQTLFREGEIEKQSLSQSSVPILLEKEIAMKCLSPSEREYDDFISSENYKYNEEETGNVPKANKLSTLLKIEGQGWYILLTSDAEKSTFNRLAKQHKGEFDGDLLLIQSPHHGAWSNHWDAFWKQRKKKNGAFAVISVGKNQYKHPSQKTVDSFIKHQYQLRYTDAVGPLRKLERSSLARKNAIALDTFSSTESNYGKDVAFEVKDSNVSEISTR